MLRQGFSLKALLEDPALLAGPPKAVINKCLENPLKNVSAQQAPAVTTLKEVKDVSQEDAFLGQLAFLGPNIWDKAFENSGNDLGLEYMGLDEFLGEHAVLESNIHTASLLNTSPGPSPQHPQALPGSAPTSPLSLTIPDQQMTSELEKHLTAQLAQQALQTPHTPVFPGPSSSPQHSPSPAAAERTVVRLPSPPSTVSEDDIDRVAYVEGECGQSPEDEDIDVDINESDIMLATAPGQKFDPRKRTFTDDELRPQPMIRKSRKQYVLDGDKDEKYWCKRTKNNVAAKRSRDARRIKENQIALRATFLEKGNQQLTADLKAAQKENEELRKRLEQYESLSLG